MPKNKAMYKRHFDKELFQTWGAPNQNAFDALFFYEINCISKYDTPGRPSKLPPPGERMEDFARKYDTTVDEMKLNRTQVEDYLRKLGIE